MTVGLEDEMSMDWSEKEDIYISKTSLRCTQTTKQIAYGLATYALPLTQYVARVINLYVTSNAGG